MVDRAILFSGIASALLSAMPAFAATPVGDPLAGLEVMRELNLVVLGDLRQNNQNVEGKTFVGGELSGGGQYGTGNGQRSQIASDRATLSVAGNVTGAGIKLHNGSNGGKGSIGSPPSVAIGGNLASGMDMNAQGARVQMGGDIRNVNGSTGSVIEAGGNRNGYLNANGATVSTGLGQDFAANLTNGLFAEQAKLAADLRAASAALASLGATDGNSIASYYGRTTFSAIDNGSGYSVFNLTDAIFQSTEFDLKTADPALTIIFNITGDGSYDWNANSIGGLNWAMADTIIWNFADAQTLNLNREIFGSVLAPNAVVTNLNQLSGSIVAHELRQRGQIRLGTFDGNMDGLSGAFAAGVVPEPASWAMMIAGFGLVGAMIRRKRSIHARVTS